MEAENPYSPPVTPVAAGPGSGYDLQVYHAAGNWRRFFNFLIDRAAVVACVFLFGVLLGVLQIFGFDGPIEWYEGIGPLGDYAFGYLATALYYAIMEGSLGLTLGKLATGTRVVDHRGLKPGWGTIWGRSLARLVPFEPFSFLGGHGWHDAWSDTLVIDIRNRQPRLSPGLRKIYNRW
jgi:uncharacterized RDD family membrane protein YckC